MLGNGSILFRFSFTKGVFDHRRHQSFQYLVLRKQDQMGKIKEFCKQMIYLENKHLLDELN